MKILIELQCLRILSKDMIFLLDPLKRTIQKNSNLFKKNNQFIFYKLFINIMEIDYSMIEDII